MNSLYLCYHSATSRQFTLAVLRELRARGLDSFLTLDETSDEALALAHAADIIVCIITPASTESLAHDSLQTKVLEQALMSGQPILALYTYGATPGDIGLERAPGTIRAGLRAIPVVMPPFTGDDALESGLDHLHGQLIALFENSILADGPPMPAQATETLQRALRLPAPDVEMLLAEAWYNRALIASDPGVRMAALDRVVDRAPGWPEPRFQRAQLRLRAGDPAGARDDCDVAAETLDDAQLWLCRGQARRQLGDSSGAEADFSRALERDAGLAAAWNGRGLCRRALGNLTGALSDFETAQTLEPPSAALYIQRGLTHKAMAAGRPSTEAEAFLLAALTDYDAALALDPGSSIALNNRGVLRLQLGDVPGAIADLDQALARDPAYESARRNRAAAEQALRRAAAAEARAAAETRVSLALGLASAGMFDQALDTLTEALELDPESAAAYHARARLRAARGERDAALEDFAKTLELEPTSALAYADRGEMYLASGELDKASRDFSRAIRAAPENAHFQFRRGLVRSEAGDYARAIEDFSGAIERGGQLGLAYYHRGLAHAALGKFDDAIADYNAALAFDPALAEAYLNRGLARAARKDDASRRAAIEDLKHYQVQSTGEDRAEVDRILRTLESRR